MLTFSEDAAWSLNNLWKKHATSTHLSIVSQSPPPVTEFLDKNF